MTDEHVERGAREEAAGAPLTPTEAEAEKRPASHTAGEPSDDSADDEPHRAGVTPLHDHLAAHRDRMIEELTGRLRLRSVAGLPEHDPDLIRSANWLATALREVGFPAVEVWGTGGGPAVYAEWCARLAATGRDARRSTLRRPALPPCPAGSRPSRTRRG